MTTIDEDRRLVAEKLLGWLPPDFDDGMDGWTLPEGSMEDQQLDYLATWNGAGEVMEALVKRCTGFDMWYCDGWAVAIDDNYEQPYSADNGPDAVIRAAAQVCRDD